ncbi:MAG TPA: HWE histidine kinase domain-containing protein [Methylomirabilota bacterium]|nr:HWE histidine kinase domain-containing protein [Methylomirabilota bacterium]
MQHYLRTRATRRTGVRQALLMGFSVAAVAVGLVAAAGYGGTALSAVFLTALGSMLLGVCLGRRSERQRASSRLRGLIDGIGPVVMLIDARGRVEHANRSAQDLIGGGPKIPLIGRVLDQVPWIGATDRAQLSALIGRASIGETVRGDASFRGPAGERVDLEIWMRPVAVARNSNWIAVSAIDVTRRREGEHVQMALMQELDHRMKNTLQMVQAMIRRTARSHRDVEAFERALVGRIQAFSRSHEILARERWLGASLRTVIGEAIGVTFEDGGGLDRVEMDGPRLWIEPRATLTLGLAVHELATNAASYGALADPRGRVTVGWRIEENDEPILAVDWREEQDLSVPAAARKGFGRHFIERAIGHELDGDVQMTFGTGGLHCSMRIPLAHVTERSVHQRPAMPGGEEVAA